MEEYMNKDIDPKFIYETETSKIFIPISILIVDEQIFNIEVLEEMIKSKYNVEIDRVMNG